MPTRVAIPQRRGRISGRPIHAPGSSAALLDLSVALGRNAATDEVNEAFHEAAEGDPEDLPGGTEETPVSSDPMGVRSEGIDAPQALVLTAGDTMTIHLTVDSVLADPGGHDPKYRNQRKRYEHLAGLLRAEGIDAAAAFGPGAQVWTGEIVNHFAWYELRQLAAHLERGHDIRPMVRGTPIHEEWTPEELDPLLVRIWDGEEETRFPHLVCHSGKGGGYIPAEFAEPVWISGSGEKDAAVTFGSSPALLRELTEIGELLRKCGAAPPPVVDALEELRDGARESVRSGLPLHLHEPELEDAGALLDGIFAAPAESPSPRPEPAHTRRVLLADGVTREEFSAAARQADWRINRIIVGDERTVPELVYLVDDDEAYATVAFVDDPSLGVRYVEIRADRPEPIVEEVRSRLATLTLGDIREMARAAASPEARIAALRRVAAAAPYDPGAGLLTEVEAGLMHADAGVRWAALGAAGYARWPELAAAIRWVASTDPDAELRGEAKRVLEGLAPTAGRRG